MGSNTRQRQTGQKATRKTRRKLQKQVSEHPKTTGAYATHLATSLGNMLTHYVELVGGDNEPCVTLFSKLSLFKNDHG